MTAHRKTRIFLVDDHPLVREWLTQLIQQEPDLTVCGEADEAPQALQAIAAAKPDLAIVDLSLKRGSGIDLIKNLKSICPELIVLVLSMHDESLYAERVLHAGARGYVMKREATQNVIAAIRRVLQGRLSISEGVAERLAEKVIEGKPAAAHLSLERLSDRELAVFELLGQGYETRRIAADLQVSPKTVQAYCARIKDKLKLTNVRELLRAAIQWQESRQAR